MKKILYMHELEQFLSHLSSNPYHLSEEQIQKYEHQLNFVFPQAVREFFSLVGLNYFFLTCCETSSLQQLPHCLEIIREEAELFMNLNAGEIIPIMEHTDQIFFIYRKDGSIPDPPLYAYYPSGFSRLGYSAHKPVLISPTFTAYVAELLALHRKTQENGRLRGARKKCDQP